MLSCSTLRTQWRRAPRNALIAPGWDANADFRAICSATNSSKLGIGSGLHHMQGQLYTHRMATTQMLPAAEAVAHVNIDLSLDCLTHCQK